MGKSLCFPCGRSAVPRKTLIIICASNNFLGYFIIFICGLNSFNHSLNIFSSRFAFANVFHHICDVIPECCNGELMMICWIYLYIQHVIYIIYFINFSQYINGNFIRRTCSYLSWISRKVAASNICLFLIQRWHRTCWRIRHWYNAYKWSRPV